MTPIALSSSRARLRPLGLTLAVPVAAAAVAACGSDTPEESGPVEVVAVDYAFEGLPSSVAVGTELTMRNDSDVEAHEVAAIRLPDDEERSVDELVQLPPDELAGFFPGVETVLIAAPGDQAVALRGTGVLDEPGRYALICVIPTGADPVEYMEAAAASEGGPPQVDGGAPHIAAGMYAELVVE